MAEIAVWLQFNSPVRIRKVSATSLTWVFGTRTSITASYSTGGTNVTIETFSQVIESAATTGTAVALAKSITVGQEQGALEVPASVADYPVTQLSPYLRNTSAAVTSGSTTTGRNFALAGQLQEILDIDVFKYIRFTGTELPAAGILMNMKNFVTMFTTEPSAAQL